MRIGTANTGTIHRNVSSTVALCCQGSSRIVRLNKITEVTAEKIEELKAAHAPLCKRCF